MSVDSKAIPEAHGPADHVLPVKTYLKVYGALVVLTYITVQVSLLDLGKIAIYVALAVAVFKATLVSGYFMHLKFGAKFNIFVFASALMFLVIFAGLTMSDIATRDLVLEEQGNFALRQDRPKGTGPAGSASVAPPGPAASAPTVGPKASVPPSTVSEGSARPSAAASAPASADPKASAAPPAGAAGSAPPPSAASSR